MGRPKGSKNWVGPLKCGHDRPHTAHGLCDPCYQRGMYHRYANKQRKRAQLYRDTGRTHAWRLNRTFGMTPLDYKTILDKQGGTCAICKMKQTWRRMAVDHDHKTNKVRGILCTRCNLVLGILENKKWQQAAHAYLAEFQ